MSLYFGIPSSNRLSTPEFSSLGLNLRKVDRISLLAIRVARSRPTSKFLMGGFASILPQVITAKTLGFPIPVCSKFLTQIATMDPIKDFDTYASFVTTDELSAKTMNDLDLAKKDPGGKYQFGYVTRNKVMASRVKDIVSAIGMKNLHPDNGVRGQGLCPFAIRATLALSKIALGYLSSQVTSQYVTNEEKDGVDWFVSALVRSSDNIKTGTEFDLIEEVLHAKPSVMTSLGFPAFEEKVDIVRCTGVEHASIFVKADNVLENTAHCFRFVKGALPCDTSFMGDLLFENFADLFDTDHSKASSKIDSILRHLPAICRTAIGQELLHIWVSISMAIRSSGFLRCVLDSSDAFLGTILQTREPLWIGENIVMPVDGNNVRTTLSSWMTRDKARASVAAFLSALPMRTGDKAPKALTANDLSTYSDLLTEIQRRKKASSLTDSVETCLNFLGYENKELAATEENITLALTNIAQKLYPTSGVVTKTLFLYHSLLVSSNLSIFGYKSVSFINPSGKKVDLYKERANDPHAKEMKKILKQKPVLAKKGKRSFESMEEEVPFWDRLCVSRVDIEQACKDFDVILATHRIFQLASYDTKILGNVDVHPFAKGESMMLTALRSFGGVEADFERSEKRPKYEEAKQMGEQIGSEDVGERDMW